MLDSCRLIEYRTKFRGRSAYVVEPAHQGGSQGGAKGLGLEASRQMAPFSNPGQNTDHPLYLALLFHPQQSITEA